MLSKQLFYAKICLIVLIFLFFRYVLPCRANAEKLFRLAHQVEAIFKTNRSLDGGAAMQAANVYLTIVHATDKAREAAFQAMDKAVLAYKVILVYSLHMEIKVVYYFDRFITRNLEKT